MFRASGRNDYPLAIASMHAYMETKQLRVQSIDHVNTGLDCWFHTVRIGVAGEPADSLNYLHANLRAPHRQKPIFSPRAVW
jgi:hypothetical protein